MPDDSTPEERLRKYKKELADMARSEGRTLESSKEEQRIESPKPEVPPANRPPLVLESPSKREMREASPFSSRRRARSEGRSTSLSRDRVMLRAREKAINSSLRDLKERKERLELLYKRKLIGREEFDRRKQELTNEGQKLLQEKAEVDRQLSA